MLMLLNLTCLGFFVAKYLILKRINFEIPLNILEYVYLGLISITLLKDVTFIIAAFRGSFNILNPRKQIISLVLLLIAWIVIPAFYTKFELEKKLFSVTCLQEYAKACLLRKLNVIIMWAYTSMLLMTVLSAACIFKLVEEEEEEDNDDNNVYNVDDEKSKPQLQQFHPRYTKNNYYNRYNVSSVHSTNSSIPPYNNLSHLK
ncbi:hypothetical protein GLOIN_2v1598996 [Rhizophagus clarus]|nr:hypothetical protein GLOIN_2v1598996 [Rhizophagus clarus]